MSPAQESAVAPKEAPAELGTVSIDARADCDRDVVRVTLTVEIPENTHIEAHEPPEPFLIPTVVEIDNLSDVHVDYPAPEVKDLGVPGARLLVYQGTITITARGEADSVARARGRLRYQPCVGRACLPPRSSSWEVVLQEDGDGRSK